MYRIGVFAIVNPENQIRMTNDLKTILARLEKLHDEVSLPKNPKIHVHKMREDLPKIIEDLNKIATTQPEKDEPAAFVYSYRPAGIHIFRH